MVLCECSHQKYSTIMLSLHDEQLLIISKFKLQNRCMAKQLRIPQDQKQRLCDTFFIQKYQPAHCGLAGNKQHGFQQQEEKPEGQHRHAKVQSSKPSSPLQKFLLKGLLNFIKKDNKVSKDSTKIRVSTESERSHTCNLT